MKSTSEEAKSELIAGILGLYSEKPLGIKDQACLCSGLENRIRVMVTQYGADHDTGDLLVGMFHDL